MAASEPLIDRLLHELPQQSRERWFAAILCGDVSVGGETVRDPRRLVDAGQPIAVRTERPFVSRAGIKLQHALDRFGLDVRGKVLLDAGAATGGFTDCLLRAGARHVHCVDVARGALAYRIRADARTTVHERTNVMHLVSDQLQPPPHAAVCDLSFRSLRGAARRLLGLVTDNWMVALVKPQYELRRATAPGFAGVVPTLEAVGEIAGALLDDLVAEQVGMHACTVAPVRGARGNRELLMLLQGAGSAALASKQRALANGLLASALADAEQATETPSAPPADR